MIDGMELIILIGFDHFGFELLEPCQSPFLQGLQFLKGNSVESAVKVAEVAEKVSDRISDLTLGVGHLAKYLIGDLDVVKIILTGNPEAQYLGTVLFDYRLGRHYSAHRCGHLLAFAVDYIAVGQNTFVRGASPSAHRSEQGTVKPAAVLITAFKVEIGR